MRKLIFVFVLGCSLLFSAAAHAYVIQDNYYGDFDNGSGAQNRDVIGDPAKFNTSKMNVALAGGDLSVDILSNYFSYVGYAGTSIGDLFISTTGWNVMGSEPYYTDTYSPMPYGGWDFAVVISSSGAANVYDITSGTILTSDYFNSINQWGTAGYNYRSGQEVKFDAIGTALASGTWTISDNILSIDVDQTLFADAFGSGSLAFHWAPTCANDVIEGRVPEPSTMLLFGAGLAGLGLLRRRWNS